ncbi:MAG: hypothetical protein EOP09_00745 [Proteobacteria bacterium]|nr:MAG: hypothetical protein EOP09_00745 [Pseudomonadota bacterium]
MKVVLDENLFSDAENDDGITQILLWGAARRHAVLLNPLVIPEEDRWPFPDSILGWIERNGSAGRNRLICAIEAGLKISAGTTQSFTLRIQTIPHPDWKKLKLPLKAAIETLDKPLALIIENQINDLKFVLAVTLPEHRESLEDALANSWIRVDHGGGSDMLNICRAKGAEPDCNLRTYALFDSDCKERGEPSNTQAKLARICDDAKIPYRVLLRRNIESYLPIPLLKKWAYNSLNNEKESTIEKIAVLEGLTSEQRSVYYYKTGLNKDAGSLPSLLAGLDKNQAEILKEGFGKNIAELFDSKWGHRSQWFRADDFELETRDIAIKVLQNL